ncbi:DUF6891 domain-containing protein [Winogradskyella sp. Asnod2-B02-A]|uniref:DUF6891 domain-containing protein n=1 Tax=Winogradskyella sp. Asnod2-B02-A TaxID=3160583 RepID=UPI0038672072
MKQDIKDEAIEQLDKDILFGFYDANGLFESISDMFYDENDFDETWLKNEIHLRLKKHQIESLNWKKPTGFDRLVVSFDTLIKDKIVALHKAGYTRQDGEGDCAEIIEELSNNGIKVLGYCYYHTQDLERAIGDEQNLFIGYDSYNHNDELAMDVANKIVKTLESNGFNVNWNGSLETRIQITDINWQKTVDNVDYNYSRVLDIMQANTPIKENATQNKKPKPFWKFW